MKQILALFLCLLVPTIAFASNSNGYKVMYDGGSLANIKTGDQLELTLGEKTSTSAKAARKSSSSPPLLSPRSAMARTSTAASAQPSASPSSASA